MAGFDTIRTAQEIAIKVMENLRFEPELCVRQISPRSTCDACAQVCPVDAITFSAPPNPGQVSTMSLDTDACIECGLCTVACPTSAFIWVNPTLMQLRNKVAKEATGYDGDVYLTCSQTGAVGESSKIITIPCLGMMPAEFWISLRSDFENVAIYLPSDLCSQCDVTTGEERLIQEISAAELVTGGSFDLVENHEDLDYVEESKTAGYDMSKRNFFSDLADVARKGASATMTTVTKIEDERPRSAIERFKDDRALDQMASGKEPLEGDEDRPLMEVGESTVLTGRRELLLETLKRHPEMADRTPLLLPRISDECTMCKACAFLCPTESLRLSGEKIILNPHTCAGCGLCSLICWPGAIELYDRNARIYFQAPGIKLVDKAEAAEREIPGDVTDSGRIHSISEITKRK